MSINIYNTAYPIIEESAKNVGFKVRINDPGLYVNPYQSNDLNV